MIVTIVIFLIILGVLIFVHELGHFLFARAFGIRVDEFAIGFGPKLWSKKVASAKHGDVIYALNAIPFGGYVKIFGEDGDASDARSFVKKPRYAQALVLCAGILFNFIFAWLLMSGAFVVGLPVSAEDYSQYSSHFRDQRIVVVDMEQGLPAEKGGIQASDSITSVSNGTVSYSAPGLTIDNIQSAINASQGKPVQIGYIPTGGGSPQTVTLTPILDPSSGHYVVGVDLDNAATLSLPFFTSLKEGAKFTVDTISATFSGVGDLIAGLFQRNTAVLSQVSGVVGIYGLVQQAASIGFSSILLLTVVISINLGVLNFLPIPALDGGRILFVLIEAVIRRPIKASFANAINTAGFALLMLLMVVVTWHDIVRLIAK